MAQQAVVVGGAGVVLFAAVALLGRHAYREFPAVYPREETALDPRTYAGVRVGVVAGGAVGAVGSALSVVDTVGTMAAVGSADGGLLATLAVAIPEGVASGTLLVATALLVASALAALGVEVRAWLRDREPDS